jgi:hypothetical protein
MLGIHCGIYKRSYNVSTILYLNPPLHHSPLSPLPHVTVSTGITFAFACVYTCFLHHIHSFTPFSHYSPLKGHSSIQSLSKQ